MWETLRGYAEDALRALWRRQDQGDLIRALVAQLDPPRKRRAIFVETGCGSSTLALAHAAADLDAFVYSCDSDDAKMDALREQLGDARDRVQFLKGDSLASVAQIAERHERIDFAYFDSAPSATHALREFLTLEPRLGAGARILIDDAALPGARLLLSPCRKGRLLVPYLLASPFWTVTGHPRAGDSMVSAVLDMERARADRSYEDPSYVDQWRRAFAKKLRPVPA
jgi:predicted O-methyltransferase YrrM